jgi:hypothetical protein
LDLVAAGLLADDDETPRASLAHFQGPALEIVLSIIHRSFVLIAGLVGFLVSHHQRRCHGRLGRHIQNGVQMGAVVRSAEVFVALQQGLALLEVFCPSLRSWIVCEELPEVRLDKEVRTTDSWTADVPDAIRDLRGGVRLNATAAETMLTAHVLPALVPDRRVQESILDEI